MPDELKSQSGSGKTPEQELMELLRQSRVQPMKTGPVSGVPPSPILHIGAAPAGISAHRGINWLAIGISVLAVGLVFGTGYFLLINFRFNTGEITLDLNEGQVNLKIDKKSYGAVDTNYVVRLRAGEHQFQLDKDGFLSLNRTIDVAKGEKLLVTFQLLPIPAIESVLGTQAEFARLSQDGTEISYFDSSDSVFKTLGLDNRQSVNLFRGSFAGTTNVIWSPVGQAAVVKMTGRHTFNLTIDNRNVKGRYVVLGQQPTQGQPKYNGITTWLFDDDQRIAAGWQPILLNDSIRQVAFSASGGEIVYIYDTADGEYSLVRALRDGQEWERMVVDMPTLATDATMEWSADGRSVLINNHDHILLADLLTKNVSEIITDRVPGSYYALSPDGSQLAYLAQAGDQTKWMIYDLVSNATQELTGITVDGKSVFTWLTNDTLVLATKNKTFLKVVVGSQDTVTVPFVGTDTDFTVTDLHYSLAGKVLMLKTDKGVFIMRI